MKFIVGQKYCYQQKTVFIVAEIGEAGEEAELRGVDTWALLRVVRKDVMAKGNLELVSSPRFETGKFFQSVTAPGRRALVSKVRNDGCEGLIRFLDETDQPFRDEEWIIANVFLADGKWRIPPDADLTAT
jgi:hypothetical protein